MQIQAIVPSGVVEGVVGYSRFSEFRYSRRCARCGAEDHGWDHDDDAPLSCSSCIPYRLADYARPPQWLQHNPQADQSWGLDRRINERSKEYLAVCHTSLSARIWRRFAGKESFLADRRQLAACSARS